MFISHNMRMLIYSKTAGVQTFKLCTDSESYMVQRASDTQGSRQSREQDKMQMIAAKELRKARSRRKGSSHIS